MRTTRVGTVTRLKTPLPRGLNMGRPGSWRYNDYFSEVIGTSPKLRWKGHGRSRLSHCENASSADDGSSNLDAVSEKAELENDDSSWVMRLRPRRAKTDYSSM